MRIKIQEQVPYSQSLRWTLQQRYYENRGLKAWLAQEVPFNLTSNAQAAKQNAVLVFQTLESLSPAPAEALHILETGGGLGLFALNFLQAFESLCLQFQRPYFQQLHYWLTDNTVNNLRELAEFPAFEVYLKDQTLGLYQLNILDPALQAHSLQGEVLSLADYSFSAMIGNYQYSPLPIAVYAHQNGQWFEKQTELYYLLAPEEQPEMETEILKELALRLSRLTLSEHLKEDHPQKSVFQALDQSIKATAQHLLTDLPASARWDLKAYLEDYLTQHWMAALHLTPGSPAADLRLTVRDALVEPLFDFTELALAQTQEEIFYREIVLEEVLTLRDRSLLNTLAELYPQMTLAFPRAALSALDHLLPLCKGICLISDKADYSLEAVAGIHEVIPSFHGNSMAYAVNFPLLEMAYQRKGYPVLRTFDEINALQTLVIYSLETLPPAVKRAFEVQFIERNLNEESHASLEAGQLFLQQGQADKAIAYLLRALRIRETDALLIYFLAVCYLQRGDYTRALSYLERPHDDYFGLLNFEVLRAEALRALGRYQEALNDYHASLQNFGEDSLVLYNLGLCHEALQDYPQALSAYQQANELNPADPEIAETLSELLQRM